MTTNVFPLFAFNDQQLRGIKIDGEAWFAAPDACRILGMADMTHVHVGKLDADEKMMATRAKHPKLFFGSFASKMTLISRPGLFKLIQRSNKPEAKAFDRWVNHEVLPQIMDTGAYIGKDADEARITPETFGGKDTT
ncbi:MAG: hypothetical protein KGL48_16220 [Sphingomonadales bacterium]|nr:hypothetical protein [Sphingomonadales bacterium]MDE2568068.1 hypothetical protein [Sphingomonadales bacterium]